MTAVTATLQINFSQADAAAGEGAIKLEVDDREDGLNGGDTNFRPGDDAYYLMYLTGAVLSLHLATAGIISLEGVGARVVAGDDAQYLTFVESKEGGLSYPASGGLTGYEWIGRVFDAGGTEIIGPAPQVVDNGNTIRFDQKLTGILKAEYNAPYTAYRLSNVAADIDRALILAKANLT